MITRYINSLWFESIFVTANEIPFICCTSLELVLYIKGFVYNSVIMHVKMKCYEQRNNLSSIVFVFDWKLYADSGFILVETWNVLFQQTCKAVITLSKMKTHQLRKMDGKISVCWVNKPCRHPPFSILYVHDKKRSPSLCSIDNKRSWTTYLKSCLWRMSYHWKSSAGLSIILTTTAVTMSQQFKE